MDANNFKNVFKNMFLNKKRENTENKTNACENQDTNKNAKRFIKYSDIIEQKIKENQKKEDLLKKFENSNSNIDVILKVAEMQKQKKLFEEDNIKKIIKKEKEEKYIKNIEDKENLLLKEDNEKEQQENDSENKISKINIYSSDSELEEDDDEKYSETVTSIPKVFHIEVCNKEWVIDVDPKK